MENPKQQELLKSFIDIASKNNISSVSIINDKGSNIYSLTNDNSIFPEDKFKELMNEIHETILSFANRYIKELE